MDTKRGKRNGFTLIELLVVIAIIALLLSILMPSLNKVKEAGKKVVCGANMHQASLAYMCYAQDYKGQIPPIVNWYTNPPEVTFSFGMTVTNNGKGVGMGLLAPGAKLDNGTRVWQGGDYLQDPSVFYCPSDKMYAAKRKSKNEWAQYPSGYWNMSYENLYIPADWSRTDMPKADWQPLQRWSTVKNPSNRVVLKDQHFFGDQVPIPKFPNPNSYNIRDFPPYHKDGTNVMRLGGSVSFVKNFKAPTNRDLSWLYYFKYVDSH